MSGGHHNGGSNDYDFDSDIELDFEADFDFYSDFDADIEVDVCVDIEGNAAYFAIDVQAIGDDGAVELNLVAFTDDDFASINATGWSAVD